MAAGVELPERGDGPLTAFELASTVFLGATCTLLGAAAELATPLARTCVLTTAAVGAGAGGVVGLFV